uniref:Mitochondrial arginine transporter BAC2 n=1 Tax=Ananas comosus var. bracteatus TaxID=296719 RepID=A0A6V7QUZ2_ANACO
MEFWPEFLASSWGREFVAGGVGGWRESSPATPRHPPNPPAAAPPSTGGIGRVSAVRLLRSIVAAEGPSALYRGMGAPLASVTFQNAMAFQVYAILSRSFDSSDDPTEPPSYKSVALGGVGTGALQSLMLSPVELVKIRLQLGGDHLGPLGTAKHILKHEGLRGIYRGLSITILRDAPSHGVYFWTYEFSREKLHPGCRKTGQESLGTMLVAGGLAGVASWVCCYPLDVVKSRIQAQVGFKRYNGIVDCFQRSVREEGVSVLWRGLGTAVARAFVVNGAIFSAYELALRFLANGN